MDKFSELKAAAEKYSITLKAHLENPKDANASAEWDAATNEFSALINNDEESIIIDLLAALEVAQKESVYFCNLNAQKNERIAELEAIATEYASKFQKAQDAAKHLVIMNDSAQTEIANLKTLLATPVQLQNCDFESVAIMAHWCTDEQLEAWVKGVEHAKKQIRAAGFKCVGDE